MRSVRLGNLIICRHVFDNYAARYPYHSDFDYEIREQRIEIAKSIKEHIEHSVRVTGSGGQTIFVCLWLNGKTKIWEGIAFPAEIGPSITKIVTSYPAGQSLINKAKLQHPQC